MPGAGELPFVGDERFELVDALVAQFDEVVASRIPRWVSIEAGTGWGKSRLAHELYGRLAADRQDDGRYWPASILHGIDHTSATSSRRKRTCPTLVEPEESSTPAWFWWGIGCDTRYGTPLQALANDLAQFELRKPGIEARWKRSATLRSRLARATRRKRGEMAEAGAGEALSIGLSVAGQAIPGLGFLSLAAKWSANALREKPRDPVTVVDVEAARSASLVEETAPGIAQVARTVLPVVIFVEDLHHADESLIEVLARVLAGNDTPVLVLTTSWPGLITEPNRPCSLLLDRVPAVRVERWTSTVDSDRLLIELSTADTRRIADDLANNLPEPVRAALADRYHNPLFLQLACGSPKLREVAERGGDLLAAARGLPREIKALYRDAWDALPIALQRTCMLAALSSPAGVSPTLGRGDDRWDVALVGAGIDAVAWLRDQIGSLDDVLGTIDDAYAWIRTVTEWLRQFHEPAQLDLARAEALDQWNDPAADLAAFYEALFERVELDGEDPERTLLHARLIVVAEAEAFIARSDTWLAAARVMCHHLSSQPDHASHREVLTLAAAAIEFTVDKTTPAAFHLRHLHTSALTRIGMVVEAIEGTEALLADLLRVLGPDDPYTLTTRNNLAHLFGESGRIADAGAAYESVLADLVRVLGPDAPDTLTTRANLASMLSRSGRIDDAIVAFESVLADRLRVLGSEAPETLSTRASLATLLGQSGHIGDATNLYASVLADQLRVLGADDPVTLSSRSNFASMLMDTGLIDDATTAYESVLADQLRVLGPDAPDTLSTRANLATLLGQSGRIEDATSAYESVLADRLRVLGPDAPDTLKTRSNLAFWLGQSGRIENAITAYDSVLPDLVRVLGRDAPDTLRSRGNHATLLGQSGRIDDATNAFGALLPDLVRALGPDAPDTFTARANIADLLGNGGRPEAASAAYEEMLADQLRVLGPDAPETLTTRANIACWLGEAGRAGDAINAFNVLLTHQLRVLGPDASDTLITRHTIASWLGQIGRVDDAVAAFEELLSDLLRVLGSDAPETLTTRANIAFYLGETGRADDAIAAFEALLADLCRALQPGIDPLVVLDLVAQVAPSADAERMRSLFREVIETWSATHGEQHPVVIRARHDRERLPGS